MPESPVETFTETTVKGAVVLVAFPTTGSAGSIAAQYLIRNLDLPLVGHVRIPELSGLISIHDGLVTSAVRIHGGEVLCKVGHDCPRIYIVTTELALPPPVLSRLAEAVIFWASQGEADMILVLEGVGRLDGDTVPDVYCAAPQPALLATLIEAGIPAMERALIAGITAQILLDAPARGMRAAGLLVEASREHPDGRAAAALVAAVAKLIPEVPVDPKPLEKEAMKLEAEIKDAQSRAELATAPAPKESFI